MCIRDSPPLPAHTCDFDENLDKFTSDGQGQINQTVTVKSDGQGEEIQTDTVKSDGQGQLDPADMPRMSARQNCAARLTLKNTHVKLTT